MSFARWLHAFAWTLNFHVKEIHATLNYVTLN